MSSGVRPPLPDLIPISKLDSTILKRYRDCAPCNFNEEEEVMGEQRSRRPGKQPAIDLIDTTRSRGLSAAPQARKTRPERHRKSDRRREHKASRKRSSSNRDLTANASSSSSPERPANPRVNPIFVWVRQQDTHIVEVKCEDYDKRNRIVLTKTAQGWRAIPRTETLVPSLKEVADEKIRHRKSRKSHRTKRKSTGVQVDGPSTDCEEPKSPVWTSPVNVETHLPSHTIHITRKRSLSPEDSVVPDVSCVNSDVNSSAQEPIPECSSASNNNNNNNNKMYDISPLDNLLAVAELEFNHQLQTGEWKDTTTTATTTTTTTTTSTLDEQERPHSVDSIKSREEENVIKDDDDNNLENKEFIENMEQLNNFIDTYSDCNAEQPENIDYPELNKAEECDYNEDDGDNLAMDDILNRLEESLRSPDAVSTNLTNIEDALMEHDHKEDENVNEHDENSKEQEDILKDDEDVLKDDDEMLKDDDEVLKDDDDMLKDDDDMLKDDDDMLKDDDEMLKDDDQMLKDDDQMLKDDDEMIKDDDEMIKEDDEMLKDDDEMLKDDDEILREDDDILKDDDEILKDDDEILKDDDEMVKDDDEMVKDDDEMVKDDDEMLKEEEELKENCKDIEEDEEINEIDEEEDDDDEDDDDDDVEEVHEIIDEQKETLQELPTDLSISKKQSEETDQPTDLSLPKNKILSPPRPISPRPPSHSSETIQSPQPSGIPAVPPSPDTFNNNTIKSKSGYLENLLTKHMITETEITTSHKEPLDLGKCRESASPTVTCSEEIRSPNEPLTKKPKIDDVTLKKLLIEKESNKVNEEIDAIIQLKHVLNNSNFNVPDPMLVPKDRLSLILSAPGKQIPKLLKERPELRLPEALSFPHLLQDPDILVITLAQLETIIQKQSQPLPLSDLRKENEKREQKQQYRRPDKLIIEKYVPEKSPIEHFIVNKPAIDRSNNNNSTDKLAASKLTADKLTVDKFAVEKFAADKFAVEKFAADKFAADKLTVEKFAAEKFAAEKFAVEKFAAEKFAVEKFAAEKLAAEKLAAEKMQMSKFTMEKLAIDNGIDKLAMDKLAMEKLPVDKATFDKLGLDKSSMERLLEDKDKLNKMNGLANDIDAATNAAFNQMMWLPYLNQLELATLGLGGNPELFKMLTSMLPAGYPAQLAEMNALFNRYPPTPAPNIIPPTYTNPLELSMWHEAMAAQTNLMKNNLYDFHNKNTYRDYMEKFNTTNSGGSTKKSNQKTNKTNNFYQSQMHNNYINYQQQNNMRHNLQIPQYNPVLQKNLMELNKMGFSSTQKNKNFHANHHHHQNNTQFNHQQSNLQSTHSNTVQNSYQNNQQSHHNSQHQNSQHQSSQHQNSQHQNSQHQNTHQNSQHQSSQHQNSQHQSSQHQSSQHQNSQHQNSQHQNSQHQNSQHLNSQHLNSLQSVLNGHQSLHQNHETLLQHFNNNNKKMELTGISNNSNKQKVTCKPISNLTYPSTTTTTTTTTISTTETPRNKNNPDVVKHSSGINNNVSVNNNNNSSTVQPIDLSGSTTTTTTTPNARLKVKQHLIDPHVGSNNKFLKHDDIPEVGSTTGSIEDIQESQKHLWHPLFGNQKNYNNPWNWSTVTAMGE